MLRQYVRASHGQDHAQRHRPGARHARGGEGDGRGHPAAAHPGRRRARSTSASSPPRPTSRRRSPPSTPHREQFLEYDLSELIYGVQQLDKKKLGLITSLPLQGSPGNPMMGQQGTGGPVRRQRVGGHLRHRRPSRPPPTELPANLDVLAVIHPREPHARSCSSRSTSSCWPASPSSSRSIPSSQYFKRQAGQAAMFGGPPAQRVERPAGPVRRLGHRATTRRRSSATTLDADPGRSCQNGRIVALPGLAQPPPGELQPASRCRPPQLNSRCSSSSRAASR